MTTRILTQEELKSQLNYDPETGVFTWATKPNRRIKIGDVAGCYSLGYISIRVFGVMYRAHRLAFLYMTGNWPTKEYIDHIDGNRANNKWLNLREATNSENCMNSAKRAKGTSGYKGVCWDKARNKWMASAMINRKTYHLGRFDDAKEAYEAYKKFAHKNHGKYVYRGL
jgi:hypothetical protein